MLSEFRELILACLEPAGARAVAGVGSEDGTFTASSEHGPGEHGSRVFCIDPYPTPALVTLAESAPEIELFKQRSLEALASIEPCDAYLIDGDHRRGTRRVPGRRSSAPARRLGPAGGTTAGGVSQDVRLAGSLWALR